MSPFERMQELAAAGVPFAVATVIRTQGSTPQVVGSKLILTGNEAERPFGTLGGGCVEADAIDAARRVLAGEPGSVREHQLTEELRGIRNREPAHFRQRLFRALRKSLACRPHSHGPRLRI